jgi:hypothetical protein
MKLNKFGLFFSLKSLDKNIDDYRFILKLMRKHGIEMYKPEIIDDYPRTTWNKLERSSSFVVGTKRKLRNIDFAIACFFDRSRSVFYQTIMAVEDRIPVLCLVKEDCYQDFPEALLEAGQDRIVLRKYSANDQLEENIVSFIESLTPRKKRFNVILRTNTLKQMEQLAREYGLTKAELLRRLVEQEYRKWDSA